MGPAGNWKTHRTSDGSDLFQFRPSTRVCSEASFSGTLCPPVAPRPARAGLVQTQLEAAPSPPPLHCPNGPTQAALLPGAPGSAHCPSTAPAHGVPREWRGSALAQLCTGHSGPRDQQTRGLCCGSCTWEMTEAVVHSQPCQWLSRECPTGSLALKPSRLS